MPEHAGESRFGPAELEREQAETRGDERQAGAGKDEERNADGQCRETGEGDGGADGEPALPMTCAPLATPVAGGHLTAAPSRSPSFRSR
jgi:hypothetical protein